METLALHWTPCLQQPLLLEQIDPIFFELPLWPQSSAEKVINLAKGFFMSSSTERTTNSIELIAVVLQRGLQMSSSQILFTLQLLSRQTWGIWWFRLGTKLAITLLPFKISQVRHLSRWKIGVYNHWIWSSSCLDNCHWLCGRWRLINIWMTRLKKFSLLG